VAAALDSEPRTHEALLLLGIPEFRVALEGGSRASQTDLWGLLLARGGELVSLAVEGKAGEAFGPTLAQWSDDASSGKERRLEALCSILGLKDVPEGSFRYQLFHRAASAVVAAHQFQASSAVLLVHNFTDDRHGWTDFQAFGKLLGTAVSQGGLSLTSCPGLPLFLGWVEGVPSSELPSPAAV
jgi:hypothetical protein